MSRVSGCFYDYDKSPDKGRQHPVVLERCHETGGKHVICSKAESCSPCRTAVPPPSGVHSSVRLFQASTLYLIQLLIPCWSTAHIIIIVITTTIIILKTIIIYKKKKKPWNSLSVRETMNHPHPTLNALQDIQLQNVGDWATLKESQDTPAAGAAAASAEAAAAAGGDDDLWTEFQGRATQEEAAAEQKAALEEEERRAKAAAAAAAEAEAARLKAEAEEEAQRAEREAAERRQREAAELARLTDRGAEEAGVEMLRQAGHQSGVDLDELGLAPREEEHEDEAMEEI